MDALHCQKDTLHKLTQCGADFVVQVKGNQPTLLATVKDLFQPYWENNGNGLAQHHTQNHGHGRREERTVFQLVANLPEELATLWPEVKSLIAVERSRCQQGKGTLDTQYYCQLTGNRRRASCQSCASALAHRKPTTLGVRCNLPGGRESAGRA